MLVPPPNFPPIETFPDWIRQQLDWPADSPLTSGAFIILHDKFDWQWRADLENRWKVEDILPNVEMVMSAS